ncbi:SDR family oxidoreductase [Paralimibaculum aggregatum]|uniref:SDR family oxidoreductase n=1 Tax=Paralimibaculum aggregatum TaxID=3036245 RepID=A0ABQ6LPW1_9RHOB|nr:SDR family NAD(P)-dependent oxidoreductase [Limibaculum sp. NKW23]GMG82988.1 SDR family oxidoreductase [Limibaculum sp. NKW23]
MMDSLPYGYTAAVLGATGGLGAALIGHLAQDRRCGRLVGLSRSGRAPAPAEAMAADLTDEASLADAAARLAAGPPLGLVVLATGYLHGPAGGPEKSLRQIGPAAMAHAFAVNATGPALAAKHLLPLLPRRRRAIFAALSARVGSISDNRSGGWYGYRASKAALNQVLRCLAIETARTRPLAVIAGLQPGTVATGLSAPFRGGLGAGAVFAPRDAAGHLLGVLDRLGPAESGRVFDWRGAEVPP